jgi:hypothetical protein
MAKPSPKEYLLPGGEVFDISEATLFVRFQGKFHAVPEFKLGAVKSQADLDSHHGDPSHGHLITPQFVREASTEEMSAYTRRPSGFKE